ncbi:MAG: hypothetical protein ACO3DQ_06470 [Cephaloticoccus sp.]
MACGAGVILTRDLLIDGACLNLPIKDRGLRRTMRLAVDGR